VDFERLYETHARRVYRLCWQMVRDDAEAEDLTQEVFIQLFRKIHTFRGEAAFTTWLHRLAVNVVLMRLRKKSRLEPPLGEGAERGEEPDDTRQERAGPATPPSEEIARLDLERAVAQLPPGFKRAVVLHDVEGYGHREIARMLGVAEGTSKSQLHKARLRLRDLLRGEGRLYLQTEAGGMSRNVAPNVFMEGRVSYGETTCA
jgi:RNA polymerase sigma-70 factor (ECF subfamily)